MLSLSFKSNLKFSVLPLNNFTLRGRWTGTNSTELNWDFQDAANGGIFTPEYSYDGERFAAFTTVNADTRTSYAAAHTTSNGNMYYRIKYTSNTGKVLYSNILKLFRSGASSDLVITQLFPNPMKTELKAAFALGTKGKTQFAVTNMAGQQVWKQEENIQYTGNYIRSWNLSNLRSGTYIFTITNGTKRVSQKFMKQ